MELTVILELNVNVQQMFDLQLSVVVAKSHLHP